MPRRIRTISPASVSRTLTLWMSWIAPLAAKRVSAALTVSTRVCAASAPCSSSVALLAHGEIVEQGTHGDLLDRGVRALEGVDFRDRMRERHGLPVYFDSAQGLGAEYQGRKAGVFVTGLVGSALAVVSLAGSPYHPVEDPVAAVVFGGSPERVLATVVVRVVVTARVEYVHNVRVPGMLHGAVVRPPTAGATLGSAAAVDAR